MSDILVLLLTLIITYVTGSIIEKKHFKKIKQREISLIRNPIVSYGIKKWTSSRKVKSAELVTGEVVIGGDYFKNFAAWLKSIFGGRLISFESILDRARREAVLRMREKARGANLIVNARIETVMFNDCNSGNNGVTQCAVIAYGTAITYE